MTACSITALYLAQFIIFGAKCETPHVSKYSKILMQGHKFTLVGKLCENLFTNSGNDKRFSSPRIPNAFHFAVVSPI